MDKQVLLDFEKLIKQYKAMSFDKIWEKADSKYKLIYNIEGLTVDNKFYANVKLIFWLDETKENLSEDAITYLYTLYCDYKTIGITTVEETFNNILTLLSNEETNSDLSNFIINGTDDFNEELKKQDINDFIQNLHFIAQGNKPCVQTRFKFELISNNKTYEFYLKSFEKDWTLSYEDNNEQVLMNEIPKKLIEWIYEIK